MVSARARRKAGDKWCVTEKRGGHGEAGQGKAGKGIGLGRAAQGMAGHGRAGQSRVGKGEGNAKDNAGNSALQGKAKGITDYVQGEGQGRADYK